MIPFKLLVIDDEAGIREAIRRALRNFTVNLSYFDDVYAIEVDAVESAEEGLALIRSNDYQIILLDNQLPGMSGLELLKILHDSRSEVVTIMITAFASIETAIDATKNGAYDFVTKPFTPQELRDALFKAVKHQVLTNTARQFAEEKRKIRWQLLATLSEELQAPLATLSDSLLQMSQKSRGSDVAEYDELIAHSLMRIREMERLLNDLLTVSGIESSAIPREVSPLRLDRLVEDVLESFAEEWRGKRLTLVRHLEPVDLTADPTEIKSMIGILTAQAIQLASPAGSVEITLTAANHRIVFSVKASNRAEVTPEARIDKVRAGVGASAVERIVAHYNGVLTVKSLEEQGVVLAVTLSQAAQPNVVKR